jgi:hypothetical protein
MGEQVISVSTGSKRPGGNCQSQADHDVERNELANVVVIRGLVVIPLRTSTRAVWEHQVDSNLLGRFGSVLRLLAEVGAFVAIIILSRLSFDCKHTRSSVLKVGGNS